MRTFGRRWFRDGSLIAEFSDTFGRAAARQKSALALNAAKVEAELASKAKSEFIANMSHELRTPLNAIIGFSNMLSLLKISDPERVNLYASYITQAAEHLLALINGILDISKIQAGRLAVEREPTPLRPIVDSCILIIEAKAKEKDIRVSCEIAADLPLLFADALRLKQVLINILSNAVKFTPVGGRIFFSAGLGDQKGLVRISIRDNGTGMSPDEVETALRPFEQVAGGLARRYEGTGLGLPISVALVRLHGGNLRIQSERGVGTEVVIELPDIIGHAEYSRLGPLQPTEPDEPATAGGGEYR